VFEPVNHDNRMQSNLSLTPAQRHLLWCIQNSPCDVVVPSMNTIREAEENTQAFRSMNTKVKTDDFERYGRRLWDRRELKKTGSARGKQENTRDGQDFIAAVEAARRQMRRTLKAHYSILRNEGLGKYILHSYNYRKGQMRGWIKKIKV